MGTRLGEQKPSCVLSCCLCWLLPWEQGSSPVCVRACVYARARTHVLLSRPGVSEPQVGWREFGVCATPSSAAPQLFPSASGWRPQNGMRERRQATGLTSGAGKEDLAPSQNSGFGANLLILAHCHMSLGGM